MNIAAIDRSLGLSGALLAVMLLAGCASTPGKNGGGPGEPTTNYFTFIATPVPAAGSATNIDVQPVPPTDGLYGGGNARIESKTTGDKNVVVWMSSSPFWIRFEGMKSNKGKNGNRFGPEDFTKASDTGVEPYRYSYRQELPAGGGKTESAKYFLTFAGVDPTDPRKALGFVLDPVIIVDR